MIRPIKGSGLCLCNYPDNKGPGRAPIDKILCGKVAKGHYEIWNSDTPERIWVAKFSCCQSAVIGGGTCLDFKLKEDSTNSDYIEFPDPPPYDYTLKANQQLKVLYPPGAEQQEFTFLNIGTIQWDEDEVWEPYTKDSSTPLTFTFCEGDDKLIKYDKTTIQYKKEADD